MLLLLTMAIVGSGVIWFTPLLRSVSNGCGGDGFGDGGGDIDPKDDDSTVRSSSEADTEVAVVGLTPLTSFSGEIATDGARVMQLPIFLSTCIETVSSQ